MLADLHKLVILKQIYKSHLEAGNIHVDLKLPVMNTRDKIASDLNNTFKAFINDISHFISEGIMVIDSAGLVQMWNNTLQNSTGIPAEDVIGRPAWDVIRDIYRADLTPDEVKNRALEYITGINSSSEQDMRKCIRFPAFDAGGRPVTFGVNLLKKTLHKEPFLYCIVSDITGQVSEYGKSEYTTICSTGRGDAAPPVIKTGRKRNLGSLDDGALSLIAEKYSRSFHLAPISLTITTRDEGVIVEVNDEFLRNTGYIRDEVEGKTVFDINIWETPEVRERILSPLKSWKPVKNREIIFRHKNGELHNYIYSGEPVRIGEVDCIISNFFDITERKKLEEALRISEEKFSRSFRVAPISLSITTLDEGTIMEVNDEFLRNTGYTRSDIIGRTVFDIRIWEPPGDRERIIPLLRQGRTIKNIEITFRHRNGDLHNYIYSAEPIVLDGLHCIISIFFDITEKKQLENALRLSEEMYKTIFESSGSAMGIVNNDTLVLVNNGMVSLSGYSKKQIEGKMTWQEFVIPEYVREIRKNARELGTDEASLINRSEFRIKDINGNIKDVYCLTALGPAPQQYVVTLVDMTEYNYLLGQINEISKREQQRVGELLHDNLIQYLTGISLLIRTMEIKKQVGRLIEMKDIRKLHDLISESLSLAKKLLKGLFLVEIDYEGLPSTLKNLATSISEIYEISCIFEEDNISENIDVIKATELYYIANEAVHNAVKHGNADEISILLKNCEDDITLEVTDNGSGIENKEIRETGGFGLKLMRFRAKMIGAKIHIGNNPDGKGVKVTCRLQKNNI